MSKLDNIAPFTVASVRVCCWCSDDQDTGVGTSSAGVALLPGGSSGQILDAPATGRFGDRAVRAVRGVPCACAPGMMFYWRPSSFFPHQNFRSARARASVECVG